MKVEIQALKRCHHSCVCGCCSTRAAKHSFGPIGMSYHSLRVLKLSSIAVNLEHVRMDYREQVRKGPIRFDSIDMLCIVVLSHNNNVLCLVLKEE